LTSELLSFFSRPIPTFHPLGFAECKILSLPWLERFLFFLSRFPLPKDTVFRCRAPSSFWSYDLLFSKLDPPVVQSPAFFTFPGLFVESLFFLLHTEMLSLLRALQEPFSHFLIFLRTGRFKTSCLLVAPKAFGFSSPSRSRLRDQFLSVLVPARPSRAPFISLEACGFAPPGSIQAFCCCAFLFRDWLRPLYPLSLSLKCKVFSIGRCSHTSLAAL